MKRMGHAASPTVLGIVDAIPDPFVVLDGERRIVYANRAASAVARRERERLIGRRAIDVLPYARGKQLAAVLASISSGSETIVVEERASSNLRWYESSVFAAADTITLYTRDVTVKRDAMELASRLARHTALRADVAAALAEETDPALMLRSCCEALVRHLGVTFARVWTLEPGASTLLMRASAGLYTHTDGAHRAVPVGKYKIGRIAAARRSHLTNDVQNDPQIGDPAWARRENLVAFAGYPLLVDGELIGVLAMFSRQTIADDTLAALEGIADIMGQGLERLRAGRELALRVAELARSNAELEQFAYVASHDLQEPLRMVASYNQLLQRRFAGQLGPEADEFIAFTVEGVTRMQRLINDLLLYSRVGTRDATHQRIDLEGVLATAIANLEVAITESGAVVTHDPLPAVHGNESQLIQVFQNLIGNAIKFRTDEPPLVHLSSEHTVDGFTISVADNGIGIEPAHFERIFIIFQRLHTRDKYQGTGIGLSICKKIIERHGGRIWVESGVGVGTTMRFNLVRPHT